MATDAQYLYQKPYETFTIDQFIACQSDTAICYNNLSFLDFDENSKIKYNTYNVLSDYVDEIIEDSLIIELNDEQLFKYKYKPKLLCFDIYGNAELAFIILIINDMYSAKDFTKNKLYMPKRTIMNTITKYVYNSNKSVIADYNDKDD